MPEAPCPPVAQVHEFAAPGGVMDLDLRLGDLVIVSGPNGSGKTSLLRLLAGLTSPVGAASVTVAGHAPETVTAPQLASMLHLAQQDPRDGMVGLTVAGEFRLRGNELPASLAPLANRDIATLSSGEVRKVALSVAESGGPRLLLLDEPTEGLDLERLSRLAALVRRAQLQGAVVAADHSGILAAMATRRVELQSTLTAAWPAMPAAAPGTVLTSPATARRRDAATVQTPAIHFGPGLHAVTGPNGCGKSTLLLGLAGLLGSTPTRIHGEPPRPGENVRLLLPRARECFTAATVASELAHTEPSICSAFVTDELRPCHPLAVSGGQAQRVALAKVLGRPSPVYLLDEPEAHLDGAGRSALADVLARRIRQGACIVAATHDPAIAAAAHSRTAMGGAP